MGLSLRRNRSIQVAVLASWMLSSGCQRLPYLDQAKPVPHDNLGRVAHEDKEIKRADLLSATKPLALFLIPGLNTFDPGAFLAVVGLLGVVAVLATLVPAARALRIDPMTALRYE